MNSSRARRGLPLAAAATVLVLAGCSGGGASQPDDSGSGAGSGGGGNSGYTIAMVTHETPGDAFWDKVRAGAEQAAKDTGSTLKYSNDPDATKQATLVQNNVDAKVDGIAVTLPTPDSMRGSVQAAVAAQIPVVALNAGLEQYENVGASMYFGSDDQVAGEAAGDRVVAAQAKHPLCVIHQTGSVSLEARCAGVKAKVPGTENIQVNGANDADVTSTLQAKLAQDPSIDYVVTLNAQIALDTLKAREAAGKDVKLQTFDLNTDVAKRIQAGEIEAAIDQQPYLQGYLAVTALYLNVKNGNDIGGGKATLTGPSFVDKDNIDKILPFVENNTR